MYIAQHCTNSFMGRCVLVELIEELNRYKAALRLGLFSQ